MKGLEDLPRIGPNLTRVASKTTPEWAERWLVNPRAFRNNTKMPRFFYLDNFEGEAGHRLTDTMVAGVTAYLFAKSEKTAPWPAVAETSRAASSSSRTSGARAATFPRLAPNGT